MDENKKAVLLLNLGGPDKAESIEPFLYNLFSDREIIRLGPTFLQKPLARLISRLRKGKTIKNYNKIGGSSPLVKITTSQASALEKKLNFKDEKFKIVPGMRYWHPLIKESIDNIISKGIRDIVAFPLFPHYSRATTGSCFMELKKHLKRSKNDINVTFIDSWYDNPKYIRALAGTISEGLENMPKRSTGDVHILFSAHSLPKSFIDEGDPYTLQIGKTIEALEKIMDIGDWSLSFQSRSGPVEWIGPETSEMLESLANRGVKKVLMVPISFVSDHIETLYEMDILYFDKSKELGIDLLRAPSLNTRPEFIDSLADIIRKNS